MHVSREVVDVEMAISKLLSRFRRLQQVRRPEWPVISAVQPLFYFIRFFGLAPFEIAADHFVLGSYNVVYSIFCIIIQTYLAYLVLSRFAGIRRGSAILDLTENTKVVFNYLITLLNAVVAVWTRKELIGVLNIVKHFDSRMRELGHPRKEGATKFWTWSTCICTVILWITVSRTGLAAFAESLSNNVSYLMNYLATSLATIKFSSIVLLLGQRFRHLNKAALQCSKESAKTKETHSAIDFKVIQQLHNSLMIAGESLNSQYSWSLLLWLVNLSIHGVSNVYFLMDHFLISPVTWAESQTPFAACIGSWIIAFAGQLLLLHIACHFTSSEANSIGSIMINSKSFAVHQNYGAASSLHLIHRQLNFSAGGCCYVNLPLLRSISAVLTTYLIILIQFKD